MLGGLVERSTTAHSSGRMLPREMMLVITASPWLAVRTDVMPGGLDASSPADESVEAAPVRTLHTRGCDALHGGRMRALIRPR